MEVVKTKKKLEAIQSSLANIENRVKDKSSTANDAREALQFRTDLNGKYLEISERLLKRGRKIDPDTNKPIYSEKFIENVTDLSELRISLLEKAIAIHNEIGDLVDKEKAELAEKAERDRIAQEEEEQMLEEEKRIQKTALAEKQRLEAEKIAKQREKELKEAAKLVATKMTDVERFLEMENARCEAFGSKTGPEALEDALGMLRTAVLDHRSPTAHLNLLKVLQGYFQNIVKLPDRKEFRRINVENEKFRNEILSISGGCEVLLAASFKLSLEKYKEETTNADVKQLFYVLEEPPLEDLDEWSEW
eukprot:CAMPEP_0204824672 /NCGR_PEP_ID=MMETSP1346-20131115/2665_1 /ASSEMBLY_ACC=CAM_ASM_000771 /TAXON_ID=215587 /ORGANISM="Aplanochytrium stocchinoi, Strain GSBS06" /LENGTH=305 /DNA_ID=CAMNT_0051951947 /DNA_START=304 /DNA_END=1218 /DNA_ORIENTATION=-